MVTCRMPNRGRLTYVETVNWIAFGKATEVDLTGFAEGWRRWGEHFSADHEPGLLRAFRAIAGGPPMWSPPKFAPDIPAEIAERLSKMPDEIVRYEQGAQHYVEKLGRPASELAKAIELDYQACVARKNAYGHGESLLSDAVAAGQIEYADPPPAVGEYLSLQHSSIWLLKADVLRLWPGEASHSSTQTRPKETQLRPVADAELTRWWTSMYIPEMLSTGQQPDRDHDFRSASAAFPNNRAPSRDRVRELRKLPGTPAHWGKRGPKTTR